MYKFRFTYNDNMIQKSYVKLSETGSMEALSREFERMVGEEEKANVIRYPHHRLVKLELKQGNTILFMQRFENGVRL